MNQRLLNKLIRREKEGILRSLSHFEGFTDFFSNDYLGLASVDSPQNLSHASSGARLISGTSKIALNAEKELAEFFNSESALFFNSGYDANLGFFSSVLQRGDTLIYDELIHASVRDGIRLSFASYYSFSHNNPDDLAKKIQSAKGTVYVAIEALYSMDGDFAPLREIQKVCKENNAYLIVDEAHSAGIFGEDGKGFVAALELEDEIFARLVTFGKAYGSHGAVILGSKKLTQFLCNFSRSFIYTTALPDATVVRNAKMVKINDLNDRRARLQENLKFFRENYSHKGLTSEINSPIQIVQIGEIEKTNLVAEKMQKNKIAVIPIFSPVIAKGHERLRICIHSFNSHDEIKNLINLLP